ncbi:zinc-ribbon domain-containing protein [Gemmobacter denitrificans]|uniref:Zinc-ribbon domain-containing protein n=1 Tax=Gemmobacter denitrificans TaxID=3123040 RepID=A0ABU8BTY0_9RHOB
MRLICPNCDAQYEVADDAIPDEGRDVQCSNCGHAWFQMSPAQLAEQAAEENLFDLPPEAPAADPQWDDGALQPVTEPEPAPEPEPLAAAPVEPPATPRRSIDESLMAVLREEAEREAQARTREAQATSPLEVQGDLGLDTMAAAPPVSAAARRIAELKGIDTEAKPEIPGPEPLSRPAKGRDLLPDIEEINSTLRPSEELTAEEDMPPLSQGRRASGGFGSGFALAMVIALVMAVTYAMAPRLELLVPALAPVLKSYVGLIDMARLWLDGLMLKAVAALEA